MRNQSYRPVPALGPILILCRRCCRGFGASGPLDPAIPYTHADDLVALLDHLDIGDAVLAGLSFGGRVALQAALAAPDRVRGLALLDAVLDGVPWDPESARALDEVPEPRWIKPDRAPLDAPCRFSWQLT